MNWLPVIGVGLWVLGLAVLMSGLGRRAWRSSVSASPRQEFPNNNRFWRFLFWSELPAVALAVLAGMIWTPVLWAAPLVGLAYALLHMAVEKRLSHPTVADLAIFLFCVVLGVNYALAVIPENALNPALRILGGIALFYAVAHWSQHELDLRWLGVLTGFVTLGLCLFSLIAVNWTSGKLFFIPLSVYERFAVFVSDAIHPNVLAGSLIALMPLLLAMPLFAWKELGWGERILFGVGLIIAMAGLLLTQSRSALLALSAALMIVFILRSSWFWIAPLAVLLVGLGLLVNFGQEEFVLRFTDLISIEGLGQRADIWTRAVYMIQDFPLTGVGLGHFSEAFRIFYPMSLDPTSHMPHAHNLFLQVGADLGIPGLVLWLSILLSSLAAAWAVYRRGKKIDRALVRAFGAGLLGCQLAIILHGFFDSVLWGEIRIAPLVWWIWGMSIAALNVVRQPENLHGTGEVLIKD